jgi:uncharacterized YigZ family protein
MLFDDTYLTIAKPAEANFADRGSKFVAYAYPISKEADVKPLLIQLRSLHPKANHHCWAMRLTPERSVFRINDDGEPSGTAGRPILNALLSKNITNTLVVVVRYFGGKLLGVPGLINAYKSATEQALTAAGVVEKTVNDIYTITFNYVQMNDVMKLIKDENIQILSQQSDNRCQLQILIKKSKVNQTVDKLNGITNIAVQYNYSN